MCVLLFKHIPSVRKANLGFFSLIGSCLKLRKIRRHSTNAASLRLQLPRPSPPAKRQGHPKGRTAALRPVSRAGKLRHGHVPGEVSGTDLAILARGMAGLSKHCLQLRPMLLPCSKHFSLLACCRPQAGPAPGASSPNPLGVRCPPAAIFKTPRLFMQPPPALHQRWP